MAELVFNDLSFEEKDQKVRVNFLKLFYFDIDKSMLESIGNFKIDDNKIEFNDISDKKAQRKFNMLLSKGFIQLKNRLNHKTAIYVHKNSGIPLMGTNYFGLIELEEYGPFQEEDIANLPSEIADLLISKGKVEEIKGG